MESTRRKFLIKVVALAAAPAALSGIGCGDDDAGGAGGGAGGGSGGGAGGGSGGGSISDGGMCADVNFELQTNATHTHTFDLSADDVAAGVGATFHLLSDSHIHDVVLSGAQLGTLASGGLVTVTSSEAGLGPHDHMVEISCVF